MRPFLEEHSERLRVRTTDAVAFPEHLHTQVEFEYIFEGTTTLVVDGCPYQMRPGDLAICFPGVVHSYQDAQDAQALLMLFLPSISQDFEALMANSCPENPILRREQLPPDVAMCMEQLRAECGRGADERVLRGYLQVILARTLPLLPLLDREPQVSDIVYGILKYLSRHFTEPVTLGELARALGVSKSHVSHTFSQRIGTNFRGYVNTLRLDFACQMLNGTDRSITEIAYECGFETQRTFNRVFQQHYGVTPTEYRQSLEGKRTE